MPSALKKTLRHGSSYFVVQIASKCMGLISFPIITRLLSVSDYGLLALANVTLLFMYGLGKCGVPRALIAHIQEKAAVRSSGQLYWDGLAATAIATVLILLVYILSLWGAGKFIRIPTFFYILPWIVFFRNIQAVHLAWLRAVERITQHNILSSCFEIGSTALGLTALVFIAPTLVTLFSARLFCEALVVLSAIAVSVMYLHNYYHRVNLQSIKSLLAFGLPLVWLELSMIVMTFGDRYQIGYLQNTEAVGFYAAAYNLAQYVQQLLAQPLVLAVFPLYNKMYATEGPEATSRFLGIVFQYYLAASIPVCVFVSCYAHEILAVLASEKYSSASGIVGIVLLANLINGGVPIISAGLYLAKQTKIIGRVTLWVAVLNFTLNWIFIWFWGYAGAAVTTLLSFSLLYIWIKNRSDQYLPLRFSAIKLVQYIVMSVTAIVLTFLISLEGLGGIIVKGGVFIGVYLFFLLISDRTLRKPLWKMVHSG